MKVYAGILTHNRPNMACSLIEKMVNDGIETFVFEHDCEIPVGYEHPLVHNFRIEDFTGEDFNISTLWLWLIERIELEHQDRYGCEDFAITIMNDDADPSPNLVRRSAQILFYHDVDIVSPGPDYIDKTEPHIIDLALRPQGWCWTVRGWDGPRPDPSMAIFFSDDDLWQQALTGRGYALSSEISCGNLDANGNLSRNPHWQKQFDIDAKTFERKWNRKAWIM